MLESIDETELRWCVYSLVEVIAGDPFYVGCTSRPAIRLNEHCRDPSGFDRRAYQRSYMKQWRAKRKDTSP